MPNNTYFDIIFAVDGDLTAVPDAPPTNGSVSYTDGFSILYSTPPASGGLNFPRAQFNQLMYDVTSAIQYIQQNGAPPFITTVMNGGSPFSYNQGVVVSYNAGSGTINWLSTASSNTTVPGAVGANWVPLNFPANSTTALSAPVNGTMHVTAPSATATFTADELIVETALGGSVYKLSSFSENINLGTTGIGGMDTGAAPSNGFVAIYAFYDPTTDAAGLVAQNIGNSVAPAIYGGSHAPAGYTACQLLTVWPTNNMGQLLNGFQAGKAIFVPTNQIISTTTSNNSLASLSIAAAVPANAKTVSGWVSTGDSLNSSHGQFVTLAGDANGVGQQTFEAQMTSATGFGFSSGFANIPVITAQHIYYLFYNNVGGSGPSTFTINVSGYTI